MSYIEINGTTCLANVVEKNRDYDWDFRKIAIIQLPKESVEIANLFEDNLNWKYGQDSEVLVNIYDENNQVIETQIKTERRFNDYSHYSLVGDITKHRNGTMTIKMGQPTAEELLAKFEEVL